MGETVELYEDSQSGWRVLSRQPKTTGYRFMIVERVGRSTLAADAVEIVGGRVPAGLERINLGSARHGMKLVGPCALWRQGHVRRTKAKPGVLTEAYIAGEVLPKASTYVHWSL